MPPRKKATTTRKKGAPSQNRLVVLRTEVVPTKDLQPFHKNPRIGDVNAVAKSMHLNGQFRPIVVNIGSKTGRKNEILAGNHTWIAARRELEWEENGEVYSKESWTDILASFVDVDDAQATKIVLADNKTSDASKYDEGILAEIFQQVENIAGTGYSNIEVEDILAGVSADVEGALERSSVDLDGVISGFEEREQDNSVGGGRSTREQYAQERPDDAKDAASARGADDAAPVDDEEELENVEASQVDAVAELQVILELKEENIYRGDNHWGIPDLLPDRILQRFPENIGTWGGHEATPDDGEKWFLYNYSLGGMKGLPLDRTILAFNTYDDKFISWWQTPAWLTARMMGKGLKIACVPDFSFYYNETRANHLWGVYRAQWLGRFFQEAGMQVVPRFQFDFRDPNTLEIGLLGIPKDTPTLECSIQNVNEDEPGDRAKAVKILREALDHINPGQFLVYGGNPGWKLFQETGWKGESIHCMNYAGVRRGVMFDKQAGAAKLTKKQKDALIEKHGGDPKAKKGRQHPSDDEL